MFYWPLEIKILSFGFGDSKALGTINILRKHLYSTKLNFTIYFFTKECSFRQKQQKKMFFNITFLTKFLVRKKKRIAQKTCKNTVVDEKSSAYLTYE